MLAISYDNPPTSTAWHNPANEIDDVDQTAGTAWITPVHDAAGNMTTVPKPTSLADGLTCKYDAWNRLVEVIDDEITVGRYTYDGLNRRIIRMYDSQSPSNPAGVDQCVHYFYNINWQVLETREAGTGSSDSTPEAEGLQPKYQYVWSPRYIDAPILRDENAGDDDLCDDDRIYFLGDANMNVIALCDSDGDAIERYHYDAYGRVTIHDATWSNTLAASLYSNPYLYTGRELDPETGLYHYRNRYYSAELGRLISRDLIEYEDEDFNLYCYVSNNPLDSVDPTGEEACRYISGHWSHDGSSSVPIHWGGMSGTASVALESVLASGLICDYCCGGDANGNVIMGKRGNISIAAYGTYSLSLNYNWLDYQQSIGLPLIGSIAVRVRAWASVTMSGPVDFSASATGNWCPPNTFGGSIRVCGTSTASVVAHLGGVASLVVRHSGLRAGVEGVGTATLFLRFCGTLEVNTGHVSGISFSSWISGGAFSALAYLDKWDAQQGKWIRHWGQPVSF